ncbi:MAG: DinB family protein [Gammaproteobacteria bacterium]|nr:DinB family protein [Gammaproteobacteria bacterium]
MELKEAIGTLSDMPEILKIYLGNLDDAELHFQPGDGNFSVLETVCHLRDIEIEGYRVRVQRILAEKNPRLPDLDGGQLARERRYRKQELRPALDDFVQARYTNLRMLEKLSKTQLVRTGFLEPLGRISLARLLELWVEHDQGHVHELEQLRTELRAPAPDSQQEFSRSTGF